MITKIEIVNFRGIKHLQFDLEKKSIIAGKNDIGKSTALNAINWLITNGLLTDKYGEGENDIQSIIPNDHRKGEHTEVSIWLNTNTKYTKVFKRDYDRNGKVKGHHTEYLINDGKVETQKAFYEALYEQLTFTPKFTKLKVDEVRLFTDPLYALLKLDYKDLRSLLVAMGCTVSNEEIYKLGFEDMRPYETQYMGKWDVMRKNLKAKSKNLNDDVIRYENQLQLFNEIDDYEDSNLKKLQSDKNELLQKKNDLRTKGVGDLVSDIDNQKTKLTLELEEKRNNKKLEYNSKIKELELEQKNIISTFNNEKAEATSKVSEKIIKRHNELFEHKNYKADVNLKIAKLKMDIQLLESELKNSTEMLDKCSDELGKLLNGDNNDFICPVCGSPIDTHASEHEYMINELSGKIQNFEKEVEQETNELNAKKLELENASHDLETANVVIAEIETAIKELEFKKQTIEHEFVLDNKANELKQEIFKLNEKVRNINLEFEEENKAINELEEKRNNLILENQKTVNEEIKNIDFELEEIDTLIKGEYQKQNDYERKCSLQETLEFTIQQFNDNESLLARCNLFIKTMCQLINDKAKEITGFDFVLLEENLSNEGISEVCYIVDDKGIPFKDINTARKTIMGIEFIEACRKITGANDLPILADKLEGLDTDNMMKLATLTNNQIICTRVSDGALRVEGV